MTKTQENFKRMKGQAYSRRIKLKRNCTKAEKVFKTLLEKYKLNYRWQTVIFTSFRYYIIDFRILDFPKTIIEIDGLSHKGKEIEDKKREKDICKRYTTYEFIRFKNEDVFLGKAEDWIKMVYIK